MEWFDHHFLVEAQEHCHKMEIPEKCKIVPYLDNCSAHLDAEVLMVQCFL